MSRVRITEYLDIDLDAETWCCHVCAAELGPARDNYKKGLLVHERDPEDLYPPIFGGEAMESEWTLSVARGYGVFIEFYCPGCGTMMENELLPEGFPPTWDIQLDLDALKARLGR